MRLKRIHVGDIIFDTGKISVTDPCYEVGSYGRMDNVKIRPGKYHCYAYVGNDKDWGKRVWINQIICADSDAEAYAESLILQKKRFTRIGSIGVDAGLAGYLSSDTDLNADSKWNAICDSMFNEDKLHIRTSVDDSYILSIEGFGNGFWTEFV